MAVQQFQYARYSTQDLLNHCGVEAREPFVPNADAFAWPPMNEIEVQTPSGTNLNDIEVGRLVEKWVDVFHAQWQYMTARLAYVHLRQQITVLTYDSVDTSTPIGHVLKQLWTNYRTMKQGWKKCEKEGFFIRKTQ